MIIVLWLFGIALLSFLTTWGITIVAKQWGMIAIPNARSTHTSPIPTGGGVAISLSIIGCLILHSIPFPYTSHYFLVLCTTALVISLIGILDDLYGLNVLLRGVLYFFVCFLYVLFLIDSTLANFGFILLASFGIAWLLNLYNFMDGVDAFAGGQAIIVGIPTSLLLYLSQDHLAALLCCTITAAVVGFLIWNWPPAKIFMGDVGSCTLGFVFGGLILLSHIENTLSIYIWLILLSWFIVDATLTLLKRLINKEKWYQAHNSHAYQLYLRMGHGHHKCAVILVSFGMLVLWPITYVAYLNPAIQLYITLSVYLFLSLTWYFIQARAHHELPSV